MKTVNHIKEFFLFWKLSVDRKITLYFAVFGAPTAADAEGLLKTKEKIITRRDFLRVAAGMS
jgi:hypothetical protein